MDQKNAYAKSGVDTEAGDKAVELMKQSVKATLSAKVIDGAGGFAGMFDISDAKSMKAPVLATSTDGVGTKVDIARRIDKHDTIGFDLVGMVVDDIAVTGAKPLMMTDYISCGKLVPERIAAIVDGIAKACLEADTALVGGETAEHPGLLAPDEYDVAGAAVGIIDKEDILGPARVKVGDVIVALASSGLHSNGYSLVRKVFSDAGFDYGQSVPDFAGEGFSGVPTLGEVLLRPTKIYSALCLELAKRLDVHTFSHITGGGIAPNLARVLPVGALGVVQRSSWEMPHIFRFVQEVGGLTQNDLDETLNLGIGMLVVLPANEAEVCINIAEAAGTKAWLCGEVIHDDPNISDLSVRAVRGTKGVEAGAAIIA
ncbi:MAG: phosphoribosylformylglycinamidine cyclo-ligase [Candidatus Ancillula sp.]|jgi:phosphoribosylformylglycinamidine cyclo-ligase|nr:phosphoribosylformylglycinamidine cyclo-ligase [Candidatus Ancillula sp.]